MCSVGHLAALFPTAPAGLVGLAAPRLNMKYTALP